MNTDCDNAAKIIRELLRTAPMGRCEDFSHALKDDRHDYTERCPCLQRYIQAREDAAKFLNDYLRGKAQP
jgi:hypothetical protein